MNPSFFGSSARPLYGVYHPARSGASAPAVLLCYPVGAEYLRAHRAFRQLATLLNRAGAHVLRFDYSGTGDSWGDPTDASLANWVDDIGTAIEELRDSAGTTRVSLAGLRLGASVAARAGLGRDDLERIVLWDPVVDGSRHATDLGLDDGPSPSPNGAGPKGSPFPPGTIGNGGFPYTPALADEIRRLDLAALEGRKDGADVHVVTSREDAAARSTVAGWLERGIRARYHLVPSEGDWAVGDRFGSALIPQAIIQGVVNCLLRGEAT